MSKKKQIEIIEEICEENGLNVYEVFRRANVPTATIQNWRNKNPGSFDALEKVNETIELMKSEKAEPVK